jgi:hypothetical protein
VDGAEWESIATHLVSGSAAFSGDSLSRIEIKGAATPMFSSLYAD